MPMTAPPTPRQDSPASRVRLGSSADPRRVLADKVNQLYSQLPLGIFGTLAVSVIAAYELREGRFSEVLLFWAGLVGLLTVARIGLYLAYRRAADRAAQAAQWLRWLAISAFATGATWGFAGAVFFPSHADEQQVFLAFLLSGMVAAGIPVYAVNVGIAWCLTQVFDSGYRLRHAYGKLTGDYTDLNQRLEQQLVELDEARHQVEASGRKLALFAERSPIAVFELDPDGRVLNVNPAAETLFGHTAGELVGMTGTDRLFPAGIGDEVRERWKSILRSREPLVGLRVQNLRRDGAEITCEWSLTPLVNAEGQVISVIAQGRDITQQLEAERMKQEFTSTLSHELRTPLTSIIGSLQLINSGVMGELDKDALDLTLIAERNGQRLLDLINDILDVEKIESGKLQLQLETIDLPELVNESITLNRAFADRFKVRLATEGELAPVRVTADRKRVLQVMTNLLSNAAKFSPEGSTVLVTATLHEEYVRVGVHDSGPGIPESFRNRIFGRFAQADMSHTRQKGGTGLGLAICKRLLEMMGGRIGFDDRAGGGTVFWFDLPLTVELD